MEPIQKPMLTIRLGRGLFFTCLLTTCLASFGAGSGIGQTLSPVNGHYYLIVNQTKTWLQARLLAEAMVFMGVQGHLATITSEDENTFVTTQLGDTAGAWLGGQQLPGSSEPAGGWQWIAGEPWVYTNWDAGEPNNTYGGGWGKDATGQSEERLQYHHDGTHWNDLPDDPEVVTPRFIVEWDVPQVDCLAPPSGLTGWWPGDGDTDDIVGGRNAVLRGDADTGPGLVGNAFVLDGDGDFVEVAHNPALNVGTGDFTVDLWVNFNSTDGEQVLVEKYVEDFSGLPPGWFLTKLEDNSLRFGTGPAFPGHGVDSPPLLLLPNMWIHFAARRSNGVASIFVNGMEVATAPFVDNADSNSSLKFGHRGSPDDTPGSLDTRGFFLNGRIDEVDLFVGRALSDTEIQAIFAAGSAGKCKIVNDFVAFEPIPSTQRFTKDTTGCPVGFAGIFSFDATLSNISDSNLANLQISVAELSDGNLLRTEDGLLGEGERFRVPRTDGFTDAQLSHGELVDVPFTVCLQEQRQFRLFVDVLGTVLTPVPMEISEKSGSAH